MARKTETATAELQTIEELQARYNSLHTRKIQAETKLEDAEKQLEQLKRDARERYGTDDVDQLREMLQKMKDENDAKRRSYQQDLDRLESDLAKVEKDFAANQTLDDDDGEA